MIIVFFYGTCAVTTVVVVAKVINHFRQEPSVTPQNNTRCKTLIDRVDVEGMVELLERLSCGAETTEAMASKLFSLYERFPPTEEFMRSVSMIQQNYQGLGSKEDYAVTTVFAVASEALMKIEKTKRLAPTSEVEDS